MAYEDGSVIIKIDADDKDAQRKLDKLSEKIEKTEDSLSQKKEKQSAIKVELDDARRSAEETWAEIQRLNEEISKLKDTGDIAGIKHPIGLAEAQASLKEQERVLKQQDAEAARLGAQYDKITDEINAGTESLEQMKAEAGELVQRLTQSPGIMERMDAATKRVDKTMDKLKNRLMSTLKSALVFSVLYKGLSMFRDYLGRALSTSKEFTAATAQLKGNLLVAFQPLWQVIIPALTQLVRLASAAAAALARLFAFLSGKSLGSLKDSAQAMTDEANAIGGAGGAAKDAGKQLAAFDEINKLEDNSGGGGSGGAAEALDTSGLDVYDEKLQNILELVLAIAAGLLTWKIAKQFNADTKTAIGLALAMGGAVYYIQAFFDAWNNGLDGGNLEKMIIGMGAAMAGLTLVFGKNGAAIGLLIGSISLLVSGFHDISASGVVTGNSLAAVETALIGIGLALSLLTGNWIPAVLGGLAALVVGFALTGEHSEEAIQGIQNICEGFAKFFAGDFKEGISQVWEGIKQLFSAGFKTIGDKINEFDAAVTNKVMGFVDNIVNKIQSFFGNIVEGIKGFIENTKALLSMLGAAWSYTWNGIFESVKGFANRILEAIENMVNLAVSAVNSISISIPDWVPFVGGNTFSPNLSEVKLPRLASGAVIPPNREFMAVLGDQKSGTNIETPLATMIQAFKQAMAETGGGQVIENVMILDGEVIYRNQKRIAKNHGVSLVGD